MVAGQRDVLTPPSVFFKRQFSSFEFLKDLFGKSECCLDTSDFAVRFLARSAVTPSSQYCISLARERVLH